MQQNKIHSWEWVPLKWDMPRNRLCASVHFCSSWVPFWPLVCGVQLASIINSAVVIVTPDNLEVQAVGWLWSANLISSLFEDSLLRNPSYVLYSQLTLFFWIWSNQVTSLAFVTTETNLSTRSFCFRKSSITETWGSVEPVVRPRALIDWTSRGECSLQDFDQSTSTFHFKQEET